MLTIRSDQIEAIQAASFRRSAHALTAEVARTQPGVDADEWMAQALRDAEALGFAEPALLTRYVKLVLEYPPDRLSGHWGAMMPVVLADPAREPAARFDFIDRHLVPRIREEGETS